MALKGAKAHAARLKRLSGAGLEREVGKALFAGGALIRVEAQVSITTGATSGKNHTPSLPGQAPNQDSGYLGNNIETVQIEPLIVEVSSNASYSTALEFGTSRMAARPFMAPARDKKRDEVEKLVADAVKRLAKRR